MADVDGRGNERELGPARTDKTATVIPRCLSVIGRDGNEEVKDGWMAGNGESCR